MGTLGVLDVRVFSFVVGAFTDPENVSGSFVAGFSMTPTSGGVLTITGALIGVGTLAVSGNLTGMAGGGFGFAGAAAWGG